MTAEIGSPAAVAPLPPEWQDWLAGNIVRGCSDPDILRSMTDNGFDEAYARVAIAVVRSMTERVQREAPAALAGGGLPRPAGYRADPIRLPSAARVRAHDREVAIAFALAGPNIALLENLLSADECARLIQLSAGKLQRSEVVDRTTGQMTASALRSSEGTHFALGENAVVERLERRIAALTGLPVENGEPLQILHYRSGGEYLPHHDYFDPQDEGSHAHLRIGGQRIATVVVYLADVDAGGETVFPKLGLAVRARRGSAVYFEYANRQGEVDPGCLHSGAPVLGGEKWIATKWLRQSAYRAAA
ncbi:MAG: 2-oxoglutarate-dependent dioxygenase [Burkholderiales bacterium]|nr:MAG: 2-oxoglutarate-dependent dioxygenase [Burkholderiales bacterium]